MTLLIWCVVFLTVIACFAGFVLLINCRRCDKKQGNVHDTDAYERFLQSAFCRQAITLFNARQYRK